MSWNIFRKRRTGAVKTILDEIDLSILFYIYEKQQSNMTDIKKLTKLSWSNLQIHKNRILPFVNIERQKDNSKILTLTPDAKTLVENFRRIYG